LLDAAFWSIIVVIAKRRGRDIIRKGGRQNLWLPCAIIGDVLKICKASSGERGDSPQNQPATNTRIQGFMPGISHSHFPAIVETPLKKRRILGTGGLTVPTPREGPSQLKTLAASPQAKPNKGGPRCFLQPLPKTIIPHQESWALLNVLDKQINFLLEILFFLLICESLSSQTLI
jgi:hypothetical protein